MPDGQRFGAVQELMNESPPPVTDMRILDSMAPLLRLGGTFDSNNFSADQAKELEDGTSDAKKIMQQARGLGRIQNGWTYPRSSLGDFGQDYDYRAAVALGGLGGLTRVEAMYFRALGPDSRGYDSARNWRLTFSAEQLPPVGPFWSSMYRITPERQFYFVDNPINRYAIGDRTPGLRRSADGSIDIWMSRSEPRMAA